MTLDALFWSLFVLVLVLVLVLSEAVLELGARRPLGYGSDLRGRRGVGPGDTRFPLSEPLFDYDHEHRRKRLSTGTES